MSEMNIPHSGKRECGFLLFWRGTDTCHPCGGDSFSIIETDKEYLNGNP